MLLDEEAKTNLMNTRHAGKVIDLELEPGCLLYTSSSVCGRYSPINCRVKPLPSSGAWMAQASSPLFWNRSSSCLLYTSNPKAALIAYASENDRNFFLEIREIDDRGNMTEGRPVTLEFMRCV